MAQKEVESGIGQGPPSASAGRVVGVSVREMPPGAASASCGGSMPVQQSAHSALQPRRRTRKLGREGSRTSKPRQRWQHKHKHMRTKANQKCRTTIKESRQNQHSTGQEPRQTGLTSGQNRHCCKEVEGKARYHGAAEEGRVTKGKGGSMTQSRTDPEGEGPRQGNPCQRWRQPMVPEAPLTPRVAVQAELGVAGRSRRGSRSPVQTLLQLPCGRPAHGEGVAWVSAEPRGPWVANRKQHGATEGCR